MFFGNYNNMNMFGMNNMFNMNMFGMNNSVSQLFCGTNSIFNNCGGFNFNSFFNPMFNSGCSLFTNCNGTMNYDAMAGFGVANALFGVGGQILNQALVNKKEYSIETIQADIKGIDAQMLEQAKKLGCSTVEEAEKYTIDPKFKEKVDTTTEAYNDALTLITTKKDELTTTQDNIATLEAELKQKPDDPDVKTKLEEQKDKKKSLEKEIQDLENKTKEGGELYKAKKEAEDAFNAENTKINDVKAEIAKLKSYKANAQAMLNDKQLNKADGKRFQRTRFEDLKAKFNENGELKTGQTVSKADVRAAIKCYGTATSQAEKTEWKNKFIALWKELDPEDRTNDLRSAYSIIAS